MLGTNDAARYREALERETLTGRCDITRESAGWNASGTVIKATAVPVRITARKAPTLSEAGGRLDPNLAATAYVPVGTPVESGDLLTFPDGSRYNVVGIYPQGFKLLEKLAVAWA